MTVPSVIHGKASAESSLRQRAGPALGEATTDQSEGRQPGPSRPDGIRATAQNPRAQTDQRRLFHAQAVVYQCHALQGPIHEEVAPRGSAIASWWPYTAYPRPSSVQAPQPRPATTVSTVIFLLLANSTSRNSSSICMSHFNPFCIPKNRLANRLPPLGILRRRFSRKSRSRPSPPRCQLRFAPLGFLTACGCTRVPSSKTASVHNTVRPLPSCSS